MEDQSMPEYNLLDNLVSFIVLDTENSLCSFLTATFLQIFMNGIILTIIIDKHWGGKMK